MSETAPKWQSNEIPDFLEQLQEKGGAAQSSKAGVAIKKLERFLSEPALAVLLVPDGFSKDRRALRLKRRRPGSQNSIERLWIGPNKTPGHVVTIEVHGELKQRVLRSEKHLLELNLGSALVINHAPDGKLLVHVGLLEPGRQLIELARLIGASVSPS